MSVMNLAFTSQYLHVNTNVSVILPDTGRDNPGEKYWERRDFDVLWLLPCLESDHTKWIRQTNVERYACENEVVVVMPSAQNSDFIDWDSYSTGFKAMSFFFEELMPMIKSWFPVSGKPEKQVIAGTTDAPIRLALIHPELFSAAIKLTGLPVDYQSFLRTSPFYELMGSEGSENARRKFRENASGEELRIFNLVLNAGGIHSFLHSDYNVLYLMEKLIQNPPETCPEFYFMIHAIDEEYENFSSAVKLSSIPVHFRVMPQYGESWEYLDSAIHKILEWRQGGKSLWH